MKFITKTKVSENTIVRASSGKPLPVINSPLNNQQNRAIKELQSASFA